MARQIRSGGNSSGPTSPRPKRDRTAAASASDGNANGAGRRERGQLRQVRLADIVAATLRARILSGELPDGSSVPKQEQLVDEYLVSPPAIREALRILETEGLVSVVRGSIGGSIVHTPRPASAAYMTAMVLEATGVTLADLYSAIRDLEPVCAASASTRGDRKEQVLPELQALIVEQVAARGNATRFATASRSFHSALTASSANQTLRVVAGALESIWTAQASEVNSGAGEGLGVYALPAEHDKVIAEHRRIWNAMKAGNPGLVKKLISHHLSDAERHPLFHTEHRVSANLLARRQSDGDDNGRTRRKDQLSSPRLADLIAESLRSRILAGDLSDGTLVPKQEELGAEYGVSFPVIREALRILETEGLVSVKRGNVGGSVVHTPRPASAAYMIALVLEASSVTLHDLYSAIREIEPICAANAAQRTDRMDAVVPRLTELIAEHVADRGDPAAFSKSARAFHTELTASSNNQTLRVVVGALESIWNAQVADFNTRGIAAFGVWAEVDEQDRTIAAHEKIVAAIAAGDPTAVERAVRDHMRHNDRHPLLESGQIVSASMLTNLGRFRRAFVAFGG